jgi:hypothetical protein
MINSTLQDDGEVWSIDRVIPIGSICKESQSEAADRGGGESGYR